MNADDIGNMFNEVGVLRDRLLEKGLHDESMKIHNTLDVFTTLIYCALESVMQECKLSGVKLGWVREFPDGDITNNCVRGVVDRVPTKFGIPVWLAVGFDGLEVVFVFVELITEGEVRLHVSDDSQSIITATKVGDLYIFSKSSKDSESGKERLRSWDEVAEALLLEVGAVFKNRLSKRIGMVCV